MPPPAQVYPTQMMSSHGILPQGNPKHSMPQHSMPLQGMSPEGMSPYGMSLHGMPQHGMQQQGMSPQGILTQRGAQTQPLSQQVQVSKFLLFYHCCFLENGTLTPPCLFCHSLNGCLMDIGHGHNIGVV